MRAGELNGRVSGDGRDGDGTGGQGAGEPRVMYLVKRVELAARAQLDEVVRPWGVTVTQYTALTVLEGSTGLTSAELARRSFVTAQSTADLVAALEERGLILRGPDPAHRRRLLISVTEAGRRLLTDCRPAVDALEARMLGNLAAGEQTLLRNALESCYRGLAGVTTT